MKTLRLPALVGLAALLLAAWSGTAWALTVPRTGTGLSQHQRELVAEKEAARKAAGIPAPPDYPSGGIIEPQPSRQYDAEMALTPQKAEDLIAQGRARSEADWARLESNGRSDLASTARKEFEREAEKLRAMAAAGQPLTIPMSEVGTQSIHFSNFSYNTPGGTALDPVTVAWYDHGSAWDVNYDMRNWTSTFWQDADGGLCQDPTQWVNIDETSHGGSQWFTSTYESLQRTSDECAYSERIHVRIYNGAYDAVHNYYWWSVGTPHEEYADAIPPTHHVTSWYDGVDAVRCSFLDAAECEYLPWFVQNMWYSFAGYSGFWKVENLDGAVLMIRLIY